MKALSTIFLIIFWILHLENDKRRDRPKFSLKHLAPINSYLKKEISKEQVEKWQTLDT